MTTSDNPYVREVGRVADSQGREVIVGVNYDTVTLYSTHVELDATRVEEVARLIVEATWQAAWQTAVSLTRADPGRCAVSPHLIGVFLAAYAGCALLGILPAAVLAAQVRQPVLAAAAVLVALTTAAVLANGAADLWSST